MTAMTDTLKAFYEMNRRSVDAEGIKSPHMAWLSNGGISLATLMGLSGGEIYVHVARILVRERPAELVFGMDRWTKPDQGVRTKDCLSVSYWTGSMWQFGIIPYQHEPAIFDPIDWNNAFFTPALATEMTKEWGRITNAPHRQPSPAMRLPLEAVS